MEAPTCVEFFCDPEANLLNYPGDKAALRAYRHKQVTIGDLHGNALKLLYILVRLNIVEITSADYHAFIRLYQLPPEEINKAHILRLGRILENIKVNRVAGLRLLGDEVCDRGKNDYFTLKIIEKLHQAKVPFEILFSNHNLNFTEAFENINQTRNNPEEYLLAPCLGGEFVRSLSNLKFLIQKGIVSETEVTDIIKNCYRPHYKPLSYSLSNGSISIYSHAPIGLETVQALAAYLKVPYFDDTARALAQTIDRINECMRNNHINNGCVKDSYDSCAMINSYCGHPIDFITDPITALVWNREYTHLKRPERHRGYNIFFVHGHDMGEVNHANIYCLDDMFGKAHTNHHGQHTEGETGMLQFVHSPANPSLGMLNLFSLRHHANRVLHDTSSFVEGQCHQLFKACLNK